MKVIIPLAGFGKRMRPLTWSRPKPLLNVADKPILGHVLDKFIPLQPEEIVFIVGWLGDQIQEYVSANYDVNASYIVQRELKGQAHALYLAKEHIQGPCVVVFVDTLFEADLSHLASQQADAVLYVKEVADPRRFGVVVEEAGRVVRLIEKPSGFEHHNAVIGLYYVREGAELVSAIEELLARNIQTKGEFYLADAFQIMIDRGARFVTEPVSAWEDCGEFGTLLQTNRYLLENGHANAVQAPGSTIVPPVYVHPSAVLDGAIVGPYASIGENVHVRNATVRDSIIDDHTTIENSCLEHSLIGRSVIISGATGQMNLGDDSSVKLVEQQIRSCRRNI
ncbi:MAG: sugar nucleotidyltransferase [Anaerolineae bacterium]